jgi:protein-glutamine gamma-glutamyltransferase
MGSFCILMENWIHTYFRFLSYSTVLSAFLTMYISGTIGIFSVFVFGCFMATAWVTEGSRVRIGERFGLVLVLLSLPVYYLVWKFNPFRIPIPQLAIFTLSQLIISLSIVKLFQRKSARDWGFLFVISFFELLLSAGSSISPIFFVCLIVYALSSIGSIVLFEISRTSATVTTVVTSKENTTGGIGVKIPIISVSLLLAVLFLAIPIFFTVPRFGSSAIGGGLQQETGYVGYSNSVQLGKLGTLQQNQRIAMRVEVDGIESIPNSYRKWRGIALDRFDNLTWSKSKFSASEVPRNIEQVYILAQRRLPSETVLQSITLEALDSSNIFSLINPIEIRGEFSGMLRDSEDSISVIGESQRTPYSVESNANYPATEVISEDVGKASEAFARYLVLPRLDPRIPDLARSVVRSQNASSRFEKARAIEKYLQTSFTYSLDLKATGNEPLADFLFDKKSGHCEYFATAMAVMLRTQGVETRLVNGFQLGEYNKTAEMYIVKQRDAHSWVEVYFPASDSWVPFDPTPSVTGTYDETGLTLAGRLTSYVEALETFWIQYFVSYDNKNQRSLFRSIVKTFRSLETYVVAQFTDLKTFLSNLWADLSGEKGLESRIYAIIKAVGIIVFLIVVIPLAFLTGRRVWRWHFWRNWKRFFRKSDEVTIVEFYERMTKALSKKGLKRSAYQTPYEFAEELNVDAAIRITENYQKVRFGKQELTAAEVSETESWLRTIETEK